MTIDATDPRTRAWLDETLQKFDVPDDETVERVSTLLRSAPVPVSTKADGGEPD